MNTITSHLDHGKSINEPKIIVVHAMGEYIGGNGWDNHAVQYLNKAGLSAHSLIAPDATNYRCRLDSETAYHALGFNTDTLGMEALVEGVHDYASFLKAIDKPYLSKIQYQCMVEQAIEWKQMHDIIKIVRHSDLSPERKVDPGNGFPWKMFLNDVGEL